MTGRAWRAATALRCAYGAPRIVSRGLPALLALAPMEAAPLDDAPARTLRATRRALALLARLPGGRWRATCLYLSVAECLALRAGGRAARVVLGVAHAATEEDGRAIAAHAWVDCPAAADVLRRGDVRSFVPLRAPAG